MSRPTFRTLSTTIEISNTGLSPTMVKLPSLFFYLDSYHVQAPPRSLATTCGISVDFFSPVEAECAIEDEANGTHTASRVTEVGVEFENRRVVLVTLGIVQRVVDRSTEREVLVELVTNFGSERYIGFFVFGAPKTELTTEVYLCISCERAAYEGECEYDFLHCRNLLSVCG